MFRGRSKKSPELSHHVGSAASSLSRQRPLLSISSSSSSSSWLSGGSTRLPCNHAVGDSERRRRLCVFCDAPGGSSRKMFSVLQLTGEATGKWGGGWNPPRPLASRAVRRICAKLKIYFWVLAEYIRTSASTELSSVCQNAPRSTDSNVKFYC